jgi:hypothetical protein
MKIFHLRSVPRQLTDDLWQMSVAKCGELLRALEAMQRPNFRHIITNMTFSGLSRSFLIRSVSLGPEKISERHCSKCEMDFQNAQSNQIFALTVS